MDGKHRLPFCYGVDIETVAAGIVFTGSKVELDRITADIVRIVCIEAEERICVTGSLNGNRSFGFHAAKRARSKCSATASDNCPQSD
ncbi:hypothetical protein DVR14_10970 [Natrinema thermotolerans]|nr:hypothetical protein DVR14_10970 [Natrinema thermotolerans]